MNKSRIIGTLSAVVFSFITQLSHAVMLVNAGFEMPDASSGDVLSTVGWDTFNDAYTINTAAMKHVRHNKIENCMPCPTTQSFQPVITNEKFHHPHTSIFS